MKNHSTAAHVRMYQVHLITKFRQVKTVIYAYVRRTEQLVIFLSFELTTASSKRRRTGEGEKGERKNFSRAQVNPARNQRRYRINSIECCGHGVGRGQRKRYIQREQKNLYDKCRYGWCSGGCYYFPRGIWVPAIEL